MEAGRVLAVLLVVLFVSAPVYVLASDRQTFFIVGTLVALLLLIVYVGNDDKKRTPTLGDRYLRGSTEGGSQNSAV